MIGRLVGPAWISQAFPDDAPQLAPDAAWTRLMDGKTILELTDSLELRRSRVMADNRVELTGFTDGMVDRLKTMGLVSELIAWRSRLFVPVSAAGPAILKALMKRHPRVRILERRA